VKKLFILVAVLILAIPSPLHADENHPINMDGGTVTADAADTDSVSGKSVALRIVLRDTSGSGKCSLAYSLHRVHKDLQKGETWEQLIARQLSLSGRSLYLSPVSGIATSKKHLLIRCAGGRLIIEPPFPNMVFESRSSR